MSEPLVETVQLDVDESNELLFKVAIEGHVVGPAKVRLVCESDQMSYLFHGHPSADQEGLVQFVLNKGLAAGVYPSRIEVMVENRYFVPVNFNIEMKKTVSVVVESVQPVKAIKRDDVRVSASQIIVKQQQPKVESRPVVIESPQPIKKTLAERYKQRKVTK